MKVLGGNSMPAMADLRPFVKVNLFKMGFPSTIRIDGAICGAQFS